MKKMIIIGGFLIMSSSLFFSFITSNMNHSQTNRTEEYAVVDVLQIKKSTYIRLTMGEEAAKEEVWKEEKTDFPGDFSPVIKKLNALNAQGFEIVNESLTYTTTSYITGGTQQAGNAFHSFLLKKKL